MNTSQSGHWMCPETMFESILVMFGVVWSRVMCWTEPWLPPYSTMQHWSETRLMWKGHRFWAPYALYMETYLWAAWVRSQNGVGVQDGIHSRLTSSPLYSLWSIRWMQQIGKKLLFRTLVSLSSVFMGLGLILIFSLAKAKLMIAFNTKVLPSKKELKCYCPFASFPITCNLYKIKIIR